MTAPSTPLMLLDQSFSDFDDLAEQARQWDLDFRQLERGAFSGSLLQLVGPQFQLAEARFRRTLVQRGNSPRGLRTIGIPATDKRNVRWRGTDVRPNQLICYPQDGALDANSFSNFHVYVLSFPEELLSVTAQIYGLTELDDCVQSAQLISIEPAGMRRLRDRLSQLCTDLRMHASVGQLNAVQETVCRVLPRQLLEALAAGRTEKARRNRVRDRALRTAVQHVDSNRRQAMSIGELCAVTQTSERTLEYAFLEHFGVTPQAYLKAMRLNGVHSQLRAAKGVRTRVSDAAQQWGFTHLSQFAADYRQMFGELPSVTLRRDAGQSGETPAKSA